VGVGRRRRWSAEAKGLIVAESYAPGAVVSEVARRHDITPQHLFAWRKATRAGRLVLPADAAQMFVPVVMAPQKTALAVQPARAASITIEFADVVVEGPATSFTQSVASTRNQPP